MAQRALLNVKPIWYMGLPGQDILVMHFEVPSNATNDAIMEDLMFNGTDDGWAGNSRDIAANTPANLISAKAVEISNKDNELDLEVYILKCLTTFPTPAIEYTRSQSFTKLVAQETLVTLYVEDLIP